MPDSPHKLQWHPAFYAAAGLELQANHQEIQMIPEYNLSKEPIRIDLLIIKNAGQAKKIENVIGHIMKKYNVIEYSSFSGTDRCYKAIISGKPQQPAYPVRTCRKSRH